MSSQPDRPVDPPPLGIRWSFTSFSGWGVFGVNLARELTRRALATPVPIYLDDLLGAAASLDPLLAPARHQQRAIAARLAADAGMLELDFPVLHGLGNQLGGGALSRRVQGRPDVGVAFIEDTEPGPAADRARRYQLILAGSAWNARLLRRFGAQHVALAPQGVDIERFRPRPKRGALAGRFVIFAGGKLEFRKGQDIVIAAFKEFHARHPEALLLAAWASPFPDAAADLVHSPYGFGAPGSAESLPDIAHWMQHAGVSPQGIALLPPLPNEELPQWLSEADAAVFVSRAEGGTNLAAMECLASGLPTVLSANTGHLDLIATVPCFPLDGQAEVRSPSATIGTSGWGETSPAAVVEALERIYGARDEARAMGMAAAAAMAAWSWPQRVEAILAELARAGIWKHR